MNPLKLVEIRRVVPSDIDRLQKISRQTFHETFSPYNTEDDMIKYLEESFSTKRLFTELSNSNSEFYFATLDNEEIGYLKINFGESQTELKDKKSVEIERIYVLRDFHGKKIGQLMYEKAIRIAQNKNAEYVWLGVWEKNARALRFYKKNGFVEFSKHPFRLGNDVQTDIMMRLKLTAVE